MKPKRVRTKSCQRCGVRPDVLYRIRVRSDADWSFCCRACLEQVKPGNPGYRYGGTWKSKKRH